MSICYVDTSVILRIVFGEKNPFKKWDLFDSAYSSSVIRVEALRTIDRLRLQGQLSDEELAIRVKALNEMMRSIGEVELTPIVLAKASDPFSTVVRTLDAIHLASAILLRDNKEGSITFLTHDRQQDIAATALGFATLQI